MTGHRSGARHATGPVTARRTLLRACGLVGAVAMVQGQAACTVGPEGSPDGSASPPQAAFAATTPAAGMSGPAPGRGRSVLVAYFSRPGENYHYGGWRTLSTGNTEFLARMIARHLDCDLHRIEAADPYPESYDATVARNVREQNADARPRIANPLARLQGYDRVLLGSPIWNVRPPMIMHSFAEALDFTGTTVHPFTTHAMSGLGTTAREYATACRGAAIGEGLAVQGEEVTHAEPAVTAWLARITPQKGTQR